jgi:hypothetical protein
MTETKLSDKVRVTNLAPWPVYFTRKLNNGDVKVPANGVIPLERAELEAQFYDGNRLLTGTDGHGAHAHLIIDDEALRTQFDIPADQQVLTDATLDKLFEIKSQSAFVKKVDELVVMDYERHRLIDYIQRKKVNDFAKVRYAEQVAGVTVTV